MEPAEVEFLAEKELVTIVPNFSLDRIHLIGGDLGPFNPGLPVEVPVWLAINLKQRQKCRLIPPEWMDVGKLEEIRDQERKEDTFTPMPSPYYMELTKLLLNYASDNIPRADEIRTLVKDTWDTRMAKLRLSADSFVRQQEAHAKPFQALAQLLQQFCTDTNAHHNPGQGENRSKNPESSLVRRENQHRSCYKARLHPSQAPQHGEG
ncbi:DNA replication complex GINS protein PSF2 isoform X2 [Serinus canaria]|uniref:DNA replication complex GINS protein PSF2 isoform X2 n=1 Tax=Serinus canaria TaxID=9135 RepID=UPI0021CCE468|nr:DNA replication complex GINS protein PSF2 isoform X2 [Serinus canaria]